ncbi:helix-turn-helix domain-containing protein [Enterococcus casseliflavus]|uniref:helix-turn-helix domain-containing protein n=1 Tax=Enterococcus casseliflavus TaxID=37734 RepID=UPI0039A75755
MDNITVLNILNKGFKEKKIINYNVYYVLKGTIYLNFQDEIKALRTSDIFILNPGEILSIKASDSIYVEIEIYRHELLKLLDNRRVIILCDSTVGENQIYSKLRIKIEEMIRGNLEENTSQLFKQATITNFLVYLITNFSNNIIIGDKNRKNEIEDYIVSNYAEDLSLQTIADKFDVTPQYFSKYFKEVFHTTFLRYLTEIRLEHALVELKKANSTILKVALEHGFPNQNSFITAFKATFKMTPAEYRNQNIEKSAIYTENNVESNDIEYLLTHKEVDQDPNTHNVEIIIPSTQNELIPFWKNLLNLGEMSKLFDNGLDAQIRDLKENIEFKTARVILDSWELYDKNLFIEEKALDFLIDLGFEIMIVLDYREAFKQENFEDYFVSFLSHYSNRYGVDRLNKTQFELMYKTQFTDKKSKEYAQYFERILSILKSFNLKSRLFGSGLLPGNDGANLRKFLKYNAAIKNLSIGIAPYSIDTYNGEIVINRSTDDGYILEQYDFSKKLSEEYKLEKLIISNWQESLNEVNSVNDSSYRSANILKNLIDVYGEIDSLPIEKPFDLMSTEISNKPLAGLSGIVSKDGIKKPAYYVYKFLNKLDRLFLYKDEVMLATNSNDKYFEIVCHNYKQPNFRFYNQELKRDHIDYYETLFEDYDIKLLRIKIIGIANGNYFLKSRTINEKHGSCFSAFNKMGFNDFSFFGKDELDFLQSAAKPLITGKKYKVTDNRIELEIFLEPNEIRHLHLIFAH